MPDALAPPGVAAVVAAGENNPTDPERQAAFNLALYGWLEALRQADKTASTRDKYRDALKAFFRWCQDTDVLLGDVSRSDVCRWRDDQAGRYGHSTIQQRLAAIRSFYDWLIEQGVLEHNPADRVKCVRGPGRQTHRRDELSDDEMRALLACFDVEHPDARRRAVELRDRAMVYLMAFCALRQIEVQRAEREHLEQKGGRVVLWVTRKGHRSPDDFVVLPAQVEQTLREWLAVHPKQAKGALFVGLPARGRSQRLTTSHIRRIVKTRLRGCGIDSPTKTTHSLRHSAITRARRGGASLTAIRAMAGHARLETTLGYLHDRTRLRKPAEDRISYGEEDSG